ncbi:MAG: hypothetical protein P8M78_03035 [Myxococcota bacterium]|nr:hypothetical protein [Myxococcota bacterium]
MQRPTNTCPKLGHRTHRAIGLLLGVLILSTGEATLADSPQTEKWIPQDLAEQSILSSRIEVFIDRLSDKIQRDAERSILKNFRGIPNLGQSSATRYRVVDYPDSQSLPIESSLKKAPRSPTAEETHSLPAALAESLLLP